MGDVIETIHGEVLDGAFFAPASSDLVDSLIGQYKQLRTDVEMMAGLINSHHASVHHFLEGNQDRDRRHYIRGVSELFKLEGAIASLNSTFWQKALNMTDVYEYMPNNRRTEWNEQIREMKTPDFEEETVRPTIMELLNSRQKFFSERVDGIFRALSGDHVTNRPEGFGKRMILARVFTDYGMTNHDMSGYIQDLRQVIAKFMGRDEPRWRVTDDALQEARYRHGEWLVLDGGALRVRAYLKGTAHLEVHPEMAWRLNCILAHLYPMAIPPEFRQKPKKKLKDFVLMSKPLPFAVLEVLAGLKAERHLPIQRNRWDDWTQPLTTNPHNRRFDWRDEDKAIRGQAGKVLEMIGGVLIKAGPQKSINIWEFDYDPARVLGEIIASGCIPDHQSHQFYPTPESLAEWAVSEAEIQPGEKCLEPSAGTGNIAVLMPADQTCCVEISALHCRVLEAKGLTVEQADFIKWAESTTERFDKVVMNPPFSEGRAKAHVEAAASLVNVGGRLVAILPSGMQKKDILPGWSCSWSGLIDNEFDGTSVSVVLLKADRK
ncbi:restriction endonuclease subunit M [Serratia marcescens]|uniref:class I SAM-dependent methyltransferase n=1 Tax=Serratia marcescens TaxID=615 RepID=UPI000D812FEB|nr:class I SAM-dependent methyltransferase [Serratia marcescens]PYA59358.1 restriction endonuclease subunit M [Serratia marcescens]PYB17796.1 restriction endonuclease subunit M [Serratia marcescens]